MRVSAIVAMAENRVIGRQNQLPWKLSEDLKRFKAITMGHPIIMGRKTFESIGRVLPGRENLIVSRQLKYTVAGAQVFPSLEAALDYAAPKSSEVFIIGGAEIYRLGMKFVQRIYLTLIRKEIEGDAFFTELPKGEFREIHREDHEGELPFSFITLER